MNFQKETFSISLKDSNLLEINQLEEVFLLYRKLKIRWVCA